MSSTFLLLLRLVDFVDEASQMNFHMTRIGLNINGYEAMLLQLLIMLIISFSIFKSSKKVFRYKLWLETE